MYSINIISVLIVQSPFMVYKVSAYVNQILLGKIANHGFLVNLFPLASFSFFYFTAFASFLFHIPNLSKIDKFLYLEYLKTFCMYKLYWTSRQ